MPDPGDGDPPEPFADDTDFCCLLVAKPTMFGKGFRKLKTPAGKTVAFYTLLPLYEAEVRYKLKNGADALLGKLDDAEVDDVIDINRAPVVGRR